MYGILRINVYIISIKFAQIDFEINQKEWESHWVASWKKKKKRKIESEMYIVNEDQGDGTKINTPTHWTVM